MVNVTLSKVYHCSNVSHAIKCDDDDGDDDNEQNGVERSRVLEVFFPEIR